MMAKKVSHERPSPGRGAIVNSPANAIPTAKVAAKVGHIEGRNNGVGGFPVHRNTLTDGRVGEKYPDAGGEKLIATSVEIAPSQDDEYSDSSGLDEAESNVGDPPVDGWTSAQGSPLADDVDLPLGKPPSSRNEVSGATAKSKKNDMSSRTERVEVATSVLGDDPSTENSRVSGDNQSRNAKEVQSIRAQDSAQVRATRHEQHARQKGGKVCSQSEAHYHDDKSHDRFRSFDGHRGKGVAATQGRKGMKSGVSRAAGRREVTIDKKTIESIALVVAKRLEKEILHRDAILSEIQATVNALSSDQVPDSVDEGRTVDYKISPKRFLSAPKASPKGTSPTAFVSNETLEAGKEPSKEVSPSHRFSDLPPCISPSTPASPGSRPSLEPKTPTDGELDSETELGKKGSPGRRFSGWLTPIISLARAPTRPQDSPEPKTLANEMLNPKKGGNEQGSTADRSSYWPIRTSSPTPLSPGSQGLRGPKTPTNWMFDPKMKPIERRSLLDWRPRISPPAWVSSMSRQSLESKPANGMMFDPGTEPSEQVSDWRPRISPWAPVSSRSQQSPGDLAVTTKRSLSPLFRLKQIRMPTSRSMAALARVRAAQKEGGDHDHPPRTSRGTKSSAYGFVDSMNRGRGGWERKNPGVPVPRVADTEGAHRSALAKLQTKAAEAAALVKQAHGTTAVYNPSWYNPECADTSLPDSELFLEYVHGYAGETPESGGHGVKRGKGGTNRRRPGKVGGGRQASTRSTNVVWLHTGELAFPASGVVVIHNVETNRQRFFMGHDEEVTAIAVHPFEDILASGQAGKGAIVCFFDTSLQDDAGVADGDSWLTTETVASGAGATPLFLREISLGENEKRGVAALDFSSDGRLIVAMAGGEGQMLSVWDWLRGVRLATARAETSFLPANSVRFNPLLYFTDARAKTVGLSSGEACYTLVSCGQGHVKFWTLTRERLYSKKVRRGTVITVAAVVDGDEDKGRTPGGDADGNGCAWTWNLASKSGTFGQTRELDTMVCMAFIGEPRVEREQWQRHGRGSEGSPDDDVELFPIVRTVTGSENGGIYFWAVKGLQPHHVRADMNDCPVGLRSHGQLLAVMPNAHEGPLTDMCYLPKDGGDNQGTTVERVVDEGEEWGTLATCGGGGTLRLWVVMAENPSPLQLLLTVDISRKGIGIGHARSVSWDLSGTTLAVGTVGNAVCLIQPGEETERPFAPSDTRREDGASVTFMLAVQGHPGSCRALASHPTRSWFVTGSSDRVLRLWDAHSRRQLSASRMLEKVCSVTFHPSGDMLAVGSEAGDLLLIALRRPSLTKEDSREQSTDHISSEGFTWEVLARKRTVLGNGSATNHAPPQTEPYSSRRHSLGKEELRGGASTWHASLVNAGGNGGDGSSSMIGTRHLANHRERRPFPAGYNNSLRGHKLRKKSSNKGVARAPAWPNVKDLSSFQQGGSLEQDGAGGDTEMTAKRGLASFSKKNADVSVVKFSPSGKVLAASSGSFIYLYREAGSKNGGSFAVDDDGGHGGSRRAYRRYAVCTGHVSKIKSIDFSRDNLVYKSNDSAGALLFWEVSTGRQITDTFSIRDLEMDSWSSSVGWPAQGLLRAAAAASGRSSNQGSTGTLFAVCRSNAGDVMAMTDEDNCLSLVRNPAPEKAKARANWGHTADSGICGLTFLCDDQHLVSVGSACIFVWRHVRREPRRARGRRKANDTAK